MSPETLAITLQAIVSIVGAVASVAVVYLQLRMAKQVASTASQVDGVHGAALTGKATAFQALARLDPSPATQAAAQAAMQEVRAYQEAKAQTAPK